MNAGLAWTLAGIALCGAELVHPGAFLLWIGVAAVATGGITLAIGLGFPLQILACLVLLAVLLCIPAVRRRGRSAYIGGVNAPDHDLVGKTCHAISFVGGEGRVRFRDGTWQARTTDGHVPTPGALLRVAGLDGTILIVGPTFDGPAI